MENGKDARSEYAGLCDHAAKGIDGIVNLLPDTPVALEAIPYFGAKRSGEVRT